MSMQGVYEHTADARAERSTLFWYTIQLSKKIEDEKETNFFDGLIYEDQLEDLHNKDENGSELEQKALKKFMSIVSYWYYNNQAEEEEIDKFLSTTDGSE